MDGFALAGHLQETPGLVGVTILMLSAADLPEYSWRSRHLGACLYLLKPIGPSDLWDIIRTALNIQPQASHVPSLG
jgi:DNA-binding response OmpR family regulator